MTKKLRVTVVGAGLIGLCCAYFLRRGGAEVTLVERHASPGMGTSFGNGAMLHGSLVNPWNTPGVGWQLLRSLGQSDAATLVRLRAVPSLLGWGQAFLASSEPRLHAAATQANRRLALHTRSLMQHLRDQEGLQYGQRLDGITVVYRSAQALAAGMTEAQALHQSQPDAAGPSHRQLDKAQLLALEPALADVADQLSGAIHYPHDEGGEAVVFCAEMAERCSRLGVVMRFGESVQLLRAAGGHGQRSAPEVLHGKDRLASDAVVLAAGPQSEALARPLGLKLPIRPAKGYSLTFKRPPGLPTPAQPIVDNALHAAVVPVGADRLRVVGTAEFAGPDLSLNQQRLANLRRLLRSLYPRIDAALAESDLQPWAGLRPMSSDGVPLIGSTTVPGLWLCTGHGQLGWTLAAGSGQCLASLLLGAEPAINAEAYAPERFAHLRQH